LLLIQAIFDYSYKANCLTGYSNELEWLRDRVLGKLIKI
jgi:hypothetical protein